MDSSVLRIIDVNINRAGEALRAAEEYARFVLNSASLAGRCKAIRHDAAALARSWRTVAGREPADCRDITGDVGAELKTDGESRRASAAGIAAAACKRAEESFRALSEYGKLVDGELAEAYETLRYRVYAIEPMLLADDTAKAALRQAQLYVLITGSLCSTDPLTACREAVAGGADIIQMREKDMEDGAFHHLAAEMAEICRNGGALFLINDRPHIALLTAASGIHGGQGDLPVHLSRRLLGYSAIIGQSTSEPALAEKALADGADYIGVGPVYETNTKQHRSPVGLDYVRWAAEWGQLPFFAIGSINRQTIDGVLEAGARAVAICTAITMAEDIAKETAFFKQKLTAGGVPCGPKAQ